MKSIVDFLTRVTLCNQVISYSHRLPTLGQTSSLLHSEHWAEITLCQHRFRPSQCFVLIKQSDSPCPRQFLVSC